MNSVQLASWQKAFIGKYLSDQPNISELISKPGSGKTITAIKLFELLYLNYYFKNFVVLTSHVVLKEQWKHILTKTLTNKITPNDVFIENVHQLNNVTKSNSLKKIFAAKTFAIIDEYHLLNKNKKLHLLLSDIEKLKNSLVLCLTTSDQNINEAIKSKYFLGTEYIYDESILKEKSAIIQIGNYSPSFNILQKLITEGFKVDNLNWREFEKLIAELLKIEGYEIELTRGSKDGGVDIIAVKDEGVSGLYKTIWQAKKLTKDKVGLSTIRELADSVHEFKASKGVIVTSTFLTSGALNRVERDKYILTKVDRNDLENWINKVLWKDN